MTMQTILYNETSLNVVGGLESKAYRVEDGTVLLADGSFISGLAEGVGVLALQNTLDVAGDIKTYSLDVGQTTITNGTNTYSLPPKFNLAVGISKDAFLNRLTDAERYVLMCSGSATVQNLFPALTTIVNNFPISLIFENAWKRLSISNSIDNTDTGLQQLLGLAANYDLLEPAANQTQSERVAEILDF